MSLRSPWEILFWDLDGTITDPRVGIIGAYQKLIAEHTLEVPHESELLWVIGPPLRQCLKKILNQTNETLIEAAVIRYRYWYVDQKLMYSDTPYPGIANLLAELKGRQVPMYLATAKAHPYAIQILEHWGLAQYFRAIHGSELDGTRSKKADLLQWIMHTHNLTAGSTIAMIGDRHHDMEAGRAHGLSTIGVEYGYGSREELVEAGAETIVGSVEDLRKAIIASV